MVHRAGRLETGLAPGGRQGRGREGVRACGTALRQPAWTDRHPRSEPGNVGTRGAAGGRQRSGRIGPEAAQALYVKVRRVGRALVLKNPLVVSQSDPVPHAPALCRARPDALRVCGMVLPLRPAASGCRRVCPRGAVSQHEDSRAGPELRIERAFRDAVACLRRPDHLLRFRRPDREPRATAPNSRRCRRRPRSNMGPFTSWRSIPTGRSCGS